MGVGEVTKRHLFLGVIVLAVGLVAAGVIAVAVLLLEGEEEDDRSTTGAAMPEIVKSEPSSSAASAGMPDIISSRPGVSIDVLGGPLSGTAGNAAQPSGLTVRGSSSATVKADQASVVAMFAPRISGPVPSAQLAARDQQAVLAALRDMGVSRERISFDTDPQFGLFATVSVQVPADELESTGKDILSAIERATGRAEQTGARFSLKDCNTALNSPRREAFEVATARARELAALASVTLGPVIAISEQASPSLYGLVQDPCSSGGANPKSGNLQPLDSPAEVEVSLDVTVTYGLGDVSGERLVTVLGAGAATAKADEAYIVVLTQEDGGPLGPQPMSTKDREDIVSNLTGLGIARDDIEVISVVFGGPVVVSVELRPGDVSRLGGRVVDAVESVVGRSQSSGVYFSHSNCLAVLAEAQRQALADAAARARALADAAGLTLAGLASIADSSAQLSPYSGLFDPCSGDLSGVALGSPYGLALKPLDAEAEFEVSAALTVSYAIGGQ